MLTNPPPSPSSPEPAPPGVRPPELEPPDPAIPGWYDIGSGLARYWTGHAWGEETLDHDRVLALLAEEPEPEAAVEPEAERNADPAPADLRPPPPPPIAAPPPPPPAPAPPPTPPPPPMVQPPAPVGIGGPTLGAAPPVPAAARAYGNLPRTDVAPFVFDGGAATYVGTGILSVLVTVCTLGICYPFAVVLRERWKAKHTLIEGRRLVFTGSAFGLFFRWLLWDLLILVTLGVYSFWVVPRMTRWRVEHQSFERG